MLTFSLCKFTNNLRMRCIYVFINLIKELLTLLAPITAPLTTVQTLAQTRRLCPWLHFPPETFRKALIFIPASPTSKFFARNPGPCHWSPQRFINPLHLFKLKRVLYTYWDFMFVCNWNIYNCGTISYKFTGLQFSDSQSFGFCPFYIYYKYWLLFLIK